MLREWCNKDARSQSRDSWLALWKKATGFRNLVNCTGTMRMQNLQESHFTQWTKEFLDEKMLGLKHIQTLQAGHSCSALNSIAKEPYLASDPIGAGWAVAQGTHKHIMKMPEHYFYFTKIEVVLWSLLDCITATKIHPETPNILRHQMPVGWSWRFQ